jgi:Tol biopolymer transport system component
MHRRALTSWLGALALAGLVLGLATPPAAEAACNLIPQTTETFDSVVGTTNRPFAAPGELIEVAVRPCDTASAGLTTTPSDQVVTVLFTPSGSPTQNVVVLTAGSCSSLSVQLNACQGQLGGGQTLCVEGSSAGLQLVQRPDGPHLQFLFPDTDALVGSIGDGLTLAGPATIAVTQATAPSLPCELATTTCSAQASGIAGLVACIDDFFTNDGACGTSQPQGIFNHFTALPYPNDFAGACISETPPCNATATQFRLTTDQDGNALLPMNWSGILVRPGGVPYPRLLSASVSTLVPISFPGQSFFASFSPDGGPLAPIFVPQFNTTPSTTVLSFFGSADAPYTVLRIARRSDNFEQCHGEQGLGLPCNGPDDCPGGCTGNNAGQRCTGDAQCPGGTCSAPSPGTCGATVCVGGSNAGAACTADSFCPGGECGPALFTLTPLVYAGNGPVVLPQQPGVCASGTNSGGACTTFSQCPGSFCLTNGFCQQDTSQACLLTSPCSSAPCVDFQLTAENPIPLASLTASTSNVPGLSNIFGLTSYEWVDGVDRNGDGDILDAVVTLRNSTTGALEPLGAPAECIGRSTLSATPPPQGRAVVQINEPPLFPPIYGPTSPIPGVPLVFPAVATQGGLLAFLESEPAEGNCDENANGAIADAILRVFGAGPTNATELTTGDQTADAAPIVNSQSVMISNGLVFFRQSEAAAAQKTTSRASVDSSGSQVTDAAGTNGTLALSADGRFVAFGSESAQLVAGDTNGAGDMFVRDRCVSNGAPVPSCTPTTERVSVNSSGAQGNSWSDFSVPAISANGRYVAFASSATNLVAGDTNGVVDVFVRDVIAGVTTRVSVDSAGVQGNNDSAPGGVQLGSNLAMSADGRYVVFPSAATNLDSVVPDTNGFSDVFLRDRCESDGVAVPGCMPSTTRMSLAADGVTQGDGDSGGVSPSVCSGGTNSGGACTSSTQCPGGICLINGFTYLGVAISADGRYVAFASNATNLVAGDTNGSPDVFVRDRCLTNGTPVAGCNPSVRRVSVASDGTEGSGGAVGLAVAPSLSADGRFVSFVSDFTTLTSPPTPAPTPTPVGTPGPAATPTPGSGSFLQVFVHDQVTGLTTLESVGLDGTEGNGDSASGSSLSADGRYLVFCSDASNLVPSDTNGASDIFLKDRVAGITSRLNVTPSGAQSSGDPSVLSVGCGVAISADGSYATFKSSASDLVAGDTNGFVDVFVRGPDPTDTASDITGDGDLNDTVLGVLDTNPVSPVLASLCPADQVSVAGGAAAFLRPESAGATPSLPNCPAGTAVSGGVDLNGNGNASDEVVHLALNSTTIQNLGVAATAVSLSGTCSGGANANAPCADNTDCPGGTCVPSVIAALVSEAGQNMDLNGDGDMNDTVVEVHPAGSGSWTNVRQAADMVQVEGTLVAFITPEAAQGNTDLNGDGDTTDRVLQLFDANTNKTTNTRMAAEEFVMGTQPASCGTGPIVAFRTSEAAQGNTDLNGNGEATDYVLQVYVPRVGVVNTHEAVTPCALQACDPRQPYLVQGDTVKFLTYEGDQQQDLNGNGTETDLILQIFDACKGTRTIVGAVDASAGTVGNPLASTGSTTPLTGVFVTTSGTCVLNGTTLLVPAMCSTDADCPQGATCQAGTPIVAAPAAIPTHEDSVVLPPSPLTVTIPAGKSSVTATLKVSVRNGDVRPKPASPGHLIQLAVSDGTCPTGTVAGLPDFVPKTPGAQTSILLKGGASKTAKVPLSITSSAFATVNRRAPFRCALSASVTAAGGGDNLDPTLANNSVPVEVNVIDHNNPHASSANDTVIKSVPPVKLTIAKHAKTESKTSTVTVQLLNADSVPATLTVTASDGTCPAGTVQVVAPSTVTVAGGRTARMKLQVTATNAGFLTANGASPSRCIATVSVAGGGTDPDPTNNTTQLVIDVTDKEDF